MFNVIVISVEIDKINAPIIATPRKKVFSVIMIQIAIFISPMISNGMIAFFELFFNFDFILLRKMTETVLTKSSIILHCAAILEIISTLFYVGFIIATFIPRYMPKWTRIVRQFLHRLI